MAITAATKLSDFSGFLKTVDVGPIFDAARRASVVQQVAPKVELGIGGSEFTVTTSKPTVGWVSEGAQKPASNGAMALKSMSPKKVAGIVVVSQEVARANPGAYVTKIREDLGEAFGQAFDDAVLHGTSTPFGAYLDQTTKAVTIGSTTAANGGVYKDLVSALSLLTAADKELTGWVLDNRLEPDFLGSLDTTGRPLYLETPYSDTVPAVRGGRLIGRQSFMGKKVGIATPGTGVTYSLGYGGDWSQLVWGQIGNISYSVSDTANVTINGTQVSCFENNLFAIRAETEFGLLINDINAFVKLTKTVP